MEFEDERTYEEQTASALKVIANELTKIRELLEREYTKTETFIYYKYI